MGAFDFAMGTLSSLSSAFSLPKGAGKNTVSLNGLSITVADNTRRAFSEFTTGMRMLHKHSIHHSYDVASIARQNLKLLHTNLTADPQYRHTVAKIRSGALKSSQKVYLPLFGDDEISSGLLYLPAGHSVVPPMAGANVRLDQNGLFPPPGSVASDNDDGYQLYLGLVGSTYIDSAPRTHMKSPGRIAVSTKQNTFESSPICVKRGDAYIEEPLYHKVHRLFTDRESGLLLSLHINTHH
jgi:hypothetical protein